MMNLQEKEDLIEQFHTLYADNAIRDRTYYPRFRRSWDEVLCRAAQMDDYPPASEDAVFPVTTCFCGIDTDFHFDQLKIQDWFTKEQKRHSKGIFYPKRVKRNINGTLTYHDAVCSYDPSAPEAALPAAGNTIIACAIPEIQPKLQVIYGNKWVDQQFSAFLKRSLALYLTETDFTGSFLLSPFEVAEYLFMMDYCIIKADYSKVKDEDLQKYLHIFRPSPLLQIKHLL